MYKGLGYFKVKKYLNLLILGGMFFCIIIALFLFSNKHNNVVEVNEVVESSALNNIQVVGIVGDYFVYIDEDGDGSVDSIYPYFIGQKMPTVSKEGYDFAYWSSSDGQYENLEENFVLKNCHNQKTFIANYRKQVIVDNVYTVTFDMYYGEDIVVKVWEDESITLPEHTIELGFTFGWTDFTENVKEDLTIIETRIPNTYEIVFNGSGADSREMQNQGLEYMSTANLNKNTYSKNGWSFMGWSDCEDCSEICFEDESEFEMNCEGITLYAVWGISVEFDENGGSEVENIFGYSGDVIVAPLTVKENYILKGWYLQEIDNNGTGIKFANSGDNIELKKTSVLYAKWEPVDFEIVFNANNDEATGVMDNQIIGFEQVENLQDNTFYVEGKMFGGWSYLSDGKIDYYSNDLFVMNCEGATLYAIWVDPIEISTTDDIIIPLDNKEIEYGKDITYMINIPEGKEISSITIDGETFTDLETLTIYSNEGVTFEGIVENHNIAVTLEDSVIFYSGKRSMGYYALVGALFMISATGFVTYLRMSYRKKQEIEEEIESE